VAHTLETERLLLRPWTADDVALLANLSSNPEVTRYIGLGHTWSAVKAIAVSDRATEHWRDHGFGWRVALELATGEDIGLIALNHMGEGTKGVDPAEHEIGWWLSPSRWGRGYAAEGARAVAADAFAAVGAPFVTARIRPENVASIHVAATIGMAFQFNTVADPGVLAAIYRASAPTAAPLDSDTSP
jgi:ribosomal-protein-alanine N-acetyltransferase